MRAHSVFPLAVLLLAAVGCSISDPAPEALAFEPLLDASDFVQQRSTHPSIVLFSKEDEARFREQTGAGPFPRPIDYARESVVGVVLSATERGERVAIRTITLHSDYIDLVIGTSEGVGVPEGAAVVAYPASFVTTRPIRRRIVGGTYTYVDL